MKKSLIALAVAGALTAPMIAQADATIFGQLEARIVNLEDNDLNIADGTSIVGIKGTTDTYIDGVTAVYRGEWDIDAAVADANTGGILQARKIYAGLKGGFGELYIGKQNNPAYPVAGATDIFTRDSGEFVLKSVAGGSAFTSLRINNALSYYTPNIGGFVGSVLVTADSGTANAFTDTADTPSFKDDDGNDIDTVVVAANYRAGGLWLGASYQDTSGKDLIAGGSNGDVEVIAVGASYRMDDLFVVANYVEMDDDDLTNDPSTYGVAAQYTVGNSTFGIGYDEFDNDTATSAFDDDRTIVSLQQALGSKVSAYIEYATYDIDGQDALTLGYKVKF